MPKWISVTLIVFILILVLLLVIPKIAKVLFIKNAQEKASLLLKESNSENTKKIEKADIKNLPYPVQNWLIHSKVIGKEQIRTVRLKQGGRMRTRKDGTWMPVKAEQYFTTDKPGFVWIADVKMAPFIQLSGRDTYLDGKGKMNIKLLSLFPVVDAKGPEMDSSTMMRYLAEMMWFPSAALSPYIKWEEVNKNAAKATIEYKGLSVSGVFFFNENGDILRFSGKRYRDINGKYILSDWGGVNKEFKEFKGIRIPSKSDVTWFEDHEDFKWFECEIKDVEYNKHTLY
ncbi:DUF6544 family protein [Bacillus sp. ISL-45]|uniref:DUF6544 family protein n=1 Tax=Bacillus sp. ISL-45 TaxID=2819128 RepID=UPI001BEB6E75|nr:DUF6544 family protein [Bacillus sp. ISL-45]MBT2663310.1 hypothetical protein [Bacillus sp. ISL-45]